MRSLKRWLVRKRVQHALRSDNYISLETATHLWALSNVIYIGPTGPSARILPEFEAFRRIADNPEIQEEQIFGLLLHVSPSVAGYALELLISRGSQRVNEAATVIGNRIGEVSMGIGCLICFSPLGAYAQSRIPAEQAAPSNR
jgi:hypothetical protein